MEQGRCIFCGIIGKQVPARVVYEDEYSIAFLDVAPRSKGMTIVAPKQHYEDFDENFELSSKVMQSALIVAEKIKLALRPLAVNIAVMKSPAIKHFHIRLYPLYENEIPIAENQPISIEDNEMDDIANKIKNEPVTVEFEKKEVKEEVVERKEPERRLSKKDVRDIKREMEVG